MSRYRPLAPRSAYVVFDSWNDVSMTADTVLCDDDPVPVGLLDVEGRPLGRVKQPVGFVRWPGLPTDSGRDSERS